MPRIKIQGNRLERMIGIAAASSAVKAPHLQKSLARLAKWGVPVAVAEQVRSVHRNFAGEDLFRARAIHSFASDPQIGTLWCARGGYGSTRLLPLLDQWKTAAAWARDPKLLIGYSDVTALHFYFFEKLGIPSLHAVMPGTPRFGAMPPRLDRLLRQILAGEIALGKKSYTREWRTKHFFARPRAAEGVIVGGNLTLLVNLIGTPWQPNLRGKILFLEDCAEAPYRVDRMLTQLANAGMLRGLHGVLLGDFETDVVYQEKREKSFWRDIFFERFAPLQIPVLQRVPVGHGRLNEPLPLGVRGAITKAGELLLLEQPVGK